jgi:hypothetical protein
VNVVNIVYVLRRIRRKPDMWLHTSGEPPNASRMAARGVSMGEEESASADLERLCQGISLSVGACTYPATVRCTSCKKWFCDAHAEDGQWHSCMLSDQ